MSTRQQLSNKIKQEVLSLPSEERLELINELIKSLNVSTQPDIDRKWKKEAEKRVAELDDNENISIDGEQVIDEIRSRLQ